MSSLELHVPMTSYRRSASFVLRPAMFSDWNFYEGIWIFYFDQILWGTTLSYLSLGALRRQRKDQFSDNKEYHSTSIILQDTRVLINGRIGIDNKEVCFKQNP